jgi:hypothetical protein
LPPGRLRLVTRPVAIGSPPLTNTRGMVEVAARAARMETFGPTINQKAKDLGSVDAPGRLEKLSRRSGAGRAVVSGSRDTEQNYTIVCAERGRQFFHGLPASLFLIARGALK